MRNSLRSSRQQRAITENKQDKMAFINRNPQTMLKELLKEQNVQLQKVKNQKCIRFQQIPMSYKYEIDIPDLNQYFEMKDKLQMENYIEECRRKVNTCRNRIEKVRLKINDQYIQELEESEIQTNQQNNIQNVFQSKNNNKKDIKQQERKIHTTISETYEKKSNQADMFNKTLYFKMRNRDLSLDEKSEKINQTIQKQSFLDSTQNYLNRSLNNTIKASQQQKQKFLGILREYSIRKESIDDDNRYKLMKIRNQIVQGQYVEM